MTLQAQDHQVVYMYITHMHACIWSSGVKTVQYCTIPACIGQQKYKVASHTCNILSTDQLHMVNYVIEKRYPLSSGAVVIQYNTTIC